MITSGTSKYTAKISARTVLNDQRRWVGEISLHLSDDLSLYLYKDEADQIVAALKRALTELSFERKTEEEE